MIHYIPNIPSNMVGFKAINAITEQDFDEIVIPKVKELVEKTGKLNYMLVLETSITNFTFGAWFKDALMGIKHLTKWNRAAIVTDVNGIRIFTDIFSVLMPGEFKGFEHKDLEKAIDWVSEKTN